ncbi:hypothetical protein D3C80_1563570 [compost metagenome]
MPGDPRGVRVVQRPALDQLQHPLGMVLGDVVEVVGHRFAYVEAAVGLEVVEDRRRQARVGLHPFQAKRPGQARAATLAGQATYVFVGIQRPVVHQRYRTFEIAAQKVPDRELRGAEAGEVLQRGH